VVVEKFRSDVELENMIEKWLWQGHMQRRVIPLVLTNQFSQSSPNKVPESMTKPTPPLSQPALIEKPVTTTWSPLHPFTNIKETSYQPPHEHTFAAAPTKPAKNKEPA
jgi:hypothetical protein